MSPALQGVCWKILSCCCFAIVNGVVTYLTRKADVTLSYNVVLFFQSIFGVIVLFPLLFGEYSLKKVKHIPFNMIRMFFAVLGTALMYASFSKIKIAEVLIISGCTGSILTVVIASTLLKEKLTIARILALSCSFLAGYFVANSAEFMTVINKLGWYALLPAASSCSLAVVNIMTRVLSKKGETAQVITAFYMVGIVPMMLIPALSDLSVLSLGSIPGSSWLLLLFLGALTFLAYHSLNRAFALAEVIFLMPLRYSKYIMSGVVGWVCFNEYPNSDNMLIAIGMLFLSIGLLALDEYLVSQKRKKLEAVFT